MINFYTMDLSDELGSPCKGGTSRKATSKLVSLINDYPKKFNLYCQVLKKEEVRLEKMKKCLDYANKVNIPYVVILGEDEINNGAFYIKDMNNKEQIEVSFDKVGTVKELIKK